MPLRSSITSESFISIYINVSAPAGKTPVPGSSTTAPEVSSCRRPEVCSVSSLEVLISPRSAALKPDLTNAFNSVNDTQREHDRFSCVDGL